MLEMLHHGIISVIEILILVMFTRFYNMNVKLEKKAKCVFYPDTLQMSLEENMMVTINITMYTVLPPTSTT